MEKSLTLEHKAHATKYATDKAQWYVLYVRAKREKPIATYINELGYGIQALCPTIKELRVYSDRKVYVETPLFKWMIFVKVRDVDRAKVFEIPGTLKYLFYLGKPGVVRPEEMSYLMTLGERKNLVTPELEPIEPGSVIDLTKMGFKDVDGVVQKVTKNHIWVFLKTIGCILKVSLK